jgi:hypothetical protein
MTTNVASGRQRFLTHQSKDFLPLLRVQLCLKKKDDVTDEFFHDYWRGNHVKLALENKKFVDKVIRYNQV